MKMLINSWVKSFFKKDDLSKKTDQSLSSSVARDRLEYVVDHDKIISKINDKIELSKTLHQSINDVLKRHIDIEDNFVIINMERDRDFLRLEIEVTLPKKGC